MKILLAVLLISPIFSEWIAPRELFSFEGDFGLSITSVYRDPTSSITHVIYCVDSLTNSRYYHNGVDDVGNLLLQTSFITGYDLKCRGVIRGAGDGQHLFFAFQDGTCSGTVYFTETADGGKTGG